MQGREASASGLTPVGLGRWYLRSGPGNVGKQTAARLVNWQLGRKSRELLVDTLDGAHFAVNTEDLIQRHIAAFGIWEPSTTRWFQSRLKPGDYVVDVGGHVGYYAVLAARLVGAEGRVISFEASGGIARPASPQRGLERVQQHPIRACSGVR